MAGRQGKAAAPGRGPKGSPLFKGYVKKTFSLPPEHAAALEREAFQRALAAGVARPDAGEILRELVQDWVAKSAKR